ncbi:MAG: aminoacyl-tRNA hydrolase [Porticoccaceae bacterium]
MNTAVKLIVGLGNPGPQYDSTRHNAGADFVSALAFHHGAHLKEEKKFFGFTGRITIDGQDVRLLIPTTYMNRSGQAVAAMANFYAIAPAAVLVAHDELDLAPGIARLKIGGGHGGHNGLRDIIKALANNNGFARLRLGIGHPGQAGDVVNFVLRKAPSAERSLLEDCIRASISVIPELAEGKWNHAMKVLHTPT